MRATIHFSLLLFFVSFSLHSFGETKILSESYSYKIDDLESYTTTIEIEGVSLQDDYDIVPFSVAEFTELKSYQLFVFKNKKWKSVNSTREITTSTISYSSFFSGSKSYYIKVPSNSHFLLRVELKEKYPIFLSRMERHGNYDADSVSYNYSLPEGLVISTNAESDLDILNGGVVTTSDLESDTIISMLIHPKESSPEDYFSYWFSTRIDPLFELSESDIPQELIVFSKNATKEELAKACFDYVKSNVKYIDIENGINAIIPRNCEKVMKNGLGDCKDMATLLTALYRYFGFEAYCAISRTNSKPGVFNFPAIHQANHMISALKLDGEWYYLDATEDACIFGDPSIQILDTEVFMIGNQEGYFHDVPNVPRSKSNVYFDYSFDETAKKINLELVTYGKMNSTFYGIHLTNHQPVNKIEEIFEIITKLKWSVDSLSIEDSRSFVRLTTDLDPSMYASLGKKKMFDLSFLPSLRMMCLLFNSSEFPVVDSPVLISLNFEGDVQLNDVDYETLSISLNESYRSILNIDLVLPSHKNKEQFKNHQINSDWEKFWSKPIITLE